MCVQCNQMNEKKRKQRKKSSSFSFYSLKLVPSMRLRLFKWNHLLKVSSSYVFSNRQAINFTFCCFNFKCFAIAALNNFLCTCFFSSFTSLMLSIRCRSFFFIGFIRSHFYFIATIQFAVCVMLLLFSGRRIAAIQLNTDQRREK